MRFKKPDPNVLNYVRKVRILTTDDQPALLDGQSRICNWLKNKLKDEVEDRIRQLVLLQSTEPDHQEKANALLTTVYSAIGLRNLVPALKASHPFLCRVH